jgi:hypothetical protein
MQLVQLVEYWRHEIQEILSVANTIAKNRSLTVHLQTENSEFYLWKTNGKRLKSADRSGGRIGRARPRAFPTVCAGTHPAAPARSHAFPAVYAGTCTWVAFNWHLSCPSTPSLSQVFSHCRYMDQRLHFTSLCTNSLAIAWSV